MMLVLIEEQASVSLPASHRAQARLESPLHINILMLVTTLHLLTRCRLVVQLAHCRCLPPLNEISLIFARTS
jgi:hypothetical protein